MFRFAFILCLIFPSLSFAGGSLDMALSQHSIRIEHGATRVGTGAYFGVGGWYHEDNKVLLGAAFNAVDPKNRSKEFIAGVGPKAFVFHEDVNELGVAVGIGGFLRYHPALAKGLGAEVIAYYAPGVLSFADLESFYETHLRVTYAVLPQARIFIGWSDVKAKYGSYMPLEESVNIGFRINY